MGPNPTLSAIFLCLNKTEWRKEVFCIFKMQMAEVSFSRLNAHNLPEMEKAMRVTQRKGDTATSQAVATFTKMGYDVSIPFTESAAYDLIVDTGELLVRVQVKYDGSKKGSVDLRSIHSNAQGYVVKRYSGNAYDWLYIYRENGAEYLIKECPIKSAIKPREEHKIIW